MVREKCGLKNKSNPAQIFGGRLRMIKVIFLIITVPYNFPFDQVDDLFGNVGGMVGDPFQVP